MRKVATSFANTDTGQEATSFLDTEPPHWAARSSAIIIILLFIAAVVASILIKLPETVSAQFTLVPVRGSDPVRASRSGVVFDVRVTEGQQVNKGDVIAIIKSEIAGERSADLLAYETQMAGAEGSLENARQRFESQRTTDEKEIAKLEERAAHQSRMIDLKQRQLEMARGILDSYEKLVKQGLSSATEQTRRQLEINQIASELEQAEADRRETLANIEKMRNEMRVRELEHREQERSLREEVAKNDIRASALKDRVIESAGNEIAVAAPCAGTILRLRVKGGGAVIGEGDVLCELACAGDELQAELSIPETGVGRIHAGQGVRLLYDAFPYQRFGIKHGTLAWISPASTDSGFRGRADIRNEAVAVNGQPRPLMPGMSGRAEIVIGRRSLISYVFEPINQLKENFSEAPAQ
jgi:membrane fusion protein